MKNTIQILVGAALVMAMAAPALAQVDERDTGADAVRTHENKDAADRLRTGSDTKTGDIHSVLFGKTSADVLRGKDAAKVDAASLLRNRSTITDSSVSAVIKNARVLQGYVHTSELVHSIAQEAAVNPLNAQRAEEILNGVPNVPGAREVALQSVGMILDEGVRTTSQTVADVSSEIKDYAGSKAIYSDAEVKSIARKLIASGQVHDEQLAIKEALAQLVMERLTKEDGSRYTKTEAENKADEIMKMNCFKLG